MIKPIKNCPECIYGNPCLRVCINATCRKPGFMCQNGFTSKNECALFHQKCETILWSQLQNIICENPNTKIPMFYQLQEQMELLFTGLIKKLKDEHLKFRKWIQLFGFSSEIMTFINMVNEEHYNNVSGVFMNQILSALFMQEEVQFDSKFNVEECKKVQKEFEESFSKLRDIYMIQPKKEHISISTAVSSEQPQYSLDSKITQELEFIKSLFPKQNIKRLNLLYRASQNNFSVQQFHKLCDQATHTVTLIETEYGKVIGGYTPLAWNSSKKHWAADKSLTSFLFSVDLREKFNLNLAQFAIACNPQKGPIFGCCDLCIVDSSNVQKSNSQFPISYNNFKYMRNAQSSTAFTGNAKGRFTTKEWQIFKVQFTQ